MEWLAMIGTAVGIVSATVVPAVVWLNKKINKIDKNQMAIQHNHEEMTEVKAEVKTMKSDLEKEVEKCEQRTLNNETQISKIYTVLGEIKTEMKFRFDNLEERIKEMQK